LTVLTDLHLGGNQISDLSPLAGLTALAELHLGKNQISDLSPLVWLVCLRKLDVEENPISAPGLLTVLENIEYTFAGLGNNKYVYAGSGNIKYRYCDKTLRKILSQDELDALLKRFGR
jgi:internalin A